LLDYIDKYRESIRGFAEITKHPIRRLINAAIEMFPKILELENIHIRLLPGEDLYVLASSLLTQHLHDLLNNAVLSVKARLATGRSEPGRIEVEVKREPAPLERQEKIGNERCRVSIWDNGLGASPEVLAQIGKPQYTTRKAEGGSGFGVFATRRYVESIHGVWLRPESTKGEFFEISFVLDVVDSLVSGGAS
jgi:signal transduction histidine kinase